jgi:hypothetical protein
VVDLISKRRYVCRNKKLGDSLWMSRLVCPATSCVKCSFDRRIILKKSLWQVEKARLVAQRVMVAQRVLVAQRVI